MPACTFRWRGVDGQEVLGFRIPAPYVTRSHDLYGQIMLSLDAADPAIGHVMCFYGVGNHGGGPTKENIEYVLANRTAFAGAELQFSTPQRFFEAVREKSAAIPVVDFELQRTFPGCYVVMQDIKRAQRHGEFHLQQVETAIDAWACEADRAAFHVRLDAAWDDLLFTEFHDILAGTSIAPAWHSVRAIQGRAEIELAMDVQFIEKYRLLQMPVQLGRLPARWRCGLAGGAVDRKPSPIEWPLHGWTSVDSLAVCSHDANSISLHDSRLTWSLLRLPRMAWSGGDGSIYSGHDDFCD